MQKMSEFLREIVKPEPNFEEVDEEVDWLGEALDIIDGVPSGGRRFLRLAERQHLIALKEHFEKERA